MESEGLFALSKLSFVDMAGAERANRTGNSGQRFKESVKINGSLLALGRCLEALRHNQMNPSTYLAPCQADKSAVATMAKTKELKKRLCGKQRQNRFRQFWKPSPVRAALLSARNVWRRCQLSLSVDD